MLKQIGKAVLQDRVSTVLDKRKVAKNGSLTWKIPTLIFDAQKYHSIDPSSIPPKTISLESIISKDGLPRPCLEATVKKYHLNLVLKIEVIQRYVLENGFLTMMKHKQVLFQYDLNHLGFNGNAKSGSMVPQQLLTKAESKQDKE